MNDYGIADGDSKSYALPPCSSIANAAPAPVARQQLQLGLQESHEDEEEDLQQEQHHP